MFFISIILCVFVMQDSLFSSNMDFNWFRGHVRGVLYMYIYVSICIYKDCDTYQFTLFVML